MIERIDAGDFYILCRTTTCAQLDERRMRGPPATSSKTARAVALASGLRGSFREVREGRVGDYDILSHNVEVIQQGNVMKQAFAIPVHKPWRMSVIPHGCPVVYDMQVGIVSQLKDCDPSSARWRRSEGPPQCWRAHLLHRHMSLPRN